MSETQDFNNFISQVIIPAFSNRTCYIAEILTELDLMTEANKTNIQQIRKHPRKPNFPVKMVSGETT